MNLKLRFALLFSLFVFIILMVSLTTVYFLYNSFRKENFAERVKTEALRAYYFQYKSSKGMESRVSLDSNTMLFNDAVFIYDSANTLVFSKQSNIKTSALDNRSLQKARDKQINFKDGHREGVAFRIQDQGAKYIIVGSALDKYGRKKLVRLQTILALTLVGGLLLSGLFAFVYVRQVAKPLVRFINQVEQISDSNLDARLTIGPNNYELKRIAVSFNNMLSGLQKSFNARRQFVQRASHEFRTPLASMLSQTEAALQKDLSPAEHKELLVSLRQYQVEMTELTNSLLLLSRLDAPSHSDIMVPVRVDEILFEAVDAFTAELPNLNVSLDFVSVPDNPNYLTIRGNQELLSATFRHLIKNGYLYSVDGAVDIKIGADEKEIQISFENKGVLLSPDEAAKIFTPFFRGQNASFKKGAGLGLAIVERSVHLHKGAVHYSTIAPDINRVEVRFNA
jgi:signal transduction histidine kinase/cbb3-type cytochrome oxidase subunit 3